MCPLAQQTNTLSIWLWLRCHLISCYSPNSLRSKQSSFKARHYIQRLLKALCEGLKLYTNGCRDIHFQYWALEIIKFAHHWFFFNQSIDCITIVPELQKIPESPPSHEFEKKIAFFRGKKISGSEDASRCRRSRDAISREKKVKPQEKKEFFQRLSNNWNGLKLGCKGTN